MKIAPCFNLISVCFVVIFCAVIVPFAANSQPQHGIAMYGTPALPHDFVSLPYANPDAPKGGKITLAEGGTFTSLNPHVRKGNVPWRLRFLAYESLMGRSYDEPFSLYGLLAKTINTDDSRRWVEFTLRPEARFSDGAPVSIEDVIWSFETLGTIGHPRYHGFWKKVEKIEQTGPHSVKLTFNVADRELPLLAGLRPILKKAQWQDKDFENSGLDVIPIGSAPYVISDFEPGQYVVMTRNKDYWGKDVPFRRGSDNFDEIRMDFYLDGSIQFEAFKAGEASFFRETNTERWETGYTFERARTGEITKTIVPHQRPSGMTGFVMNTRKPIFADWRVREAMIQAFNFEQINQANNGGRQKRISSYFSNSPLSMRSGPATGRVKELLTPFAAELLPGALEGYSLPVSDGTARNRKGTRKALELLEQAGWRVQNGILQNAQGQAFAFHILLKQGDAESQVMMDIFQQSLRRLGIKADITILDPAQYKLRIDEYDFDMVYFRRGLSLSPGNEQYLYWGAQGVTQPGTRNLMGMNVPAAEAMIDTLVNAKSHDDFIAAAQALDRILMAGRYVIPIQTSNISLLAHDTRLKHPAHLPLYGDWLGFFPNVWWEEPQ